MVACPMPENGPICSFGQEEGRTVVRRPKGILGKRDRKRFKNNPQPPSREPETKGADGLSRSDKEDYVRFGRGDVRPTMYGEHGGGF